MKRFFIIVLLVMPLCSRAQIVADFAGGGSALGDGGPAVNAHVYNPAKGMFDIHGNYYFASPGEERVRKIDPSGIITTVAGTGTTGYNGDGIAANTAQLSGPSGIALDSVGNVYIADGGNNRIRKVDIATGIISTIVGNGTGGYGGDSGLALDAKIFDPISICFDRAGNLYIGDYYNERVRKVNTSGIITTFAGNGIGGYGGDGSLADTGRIGGIQDICIDVIGNVYLADNTNSRVFKVNTSGIITTVAGTTTGYLFNGDDIPATSANLDPYFLCLDDSDHLIIAENQNYRVRKIDGAGIIHTIVGTGVSGFSGNGGPALDADFYYPGGLCFDACGNLIIPDVGNSEIRKVTFNTTATPTIAIATITDTVCAGTAVTYTASVTGSSTFAYKWVVNGTVVATTGSSYTYAPANGDSICCILAGTGECSGAADTVSSNTIHMVVDSFVVPTISLSGPPAEFPGTTFTVTATLTNAGSSYLIRWFNNGILFNTTTTSSVTYTEYTDIAITAELVQQSFHCNDSASSDTLFVIALQAVGVVTAPHFAVSPNPAHNEIAITGNGLHTVTIANAIGQLLLSKDAGTNKVSIDISSLPSGLYLVAVTGTDGSREVSKIVKQ